jgi:predicted transcriptional regulator
MARGIDDPKTRAATITLYIDKGPFTRALGIATEEAISLVVVDRSGRVDWQTIGTYTPEKERALREVLSGR